MKPALVLVEGQTEERFIKDVLRDHFWQLGLILIPTIITTKRAKTGNTFKGGVASFGKFENDAQRLLRGAGGAVVTTMLDYYMLPGDFPGMDSRPPGNPVVRVRHVEEAIHHHFGAPQNFAPYLSLHEFEALLFVSEDELPRAVIAQQGVEQFAAIRKEFGTPEDINERPGQGPSQRIAALFPQYRKPLHGPTIAKRIGLPRLRAACPHFNDWIERLELFAGS